MSQDTQRPPGPPADPAEAALEALRAARAAAPEPAWSAVTAYAAGAATPAEVSAVEARLAVDPDLEAVVDALRAPDPRLSAAVTRAVEATLPAPAGARSAWPSRAATTTARPSRRLVLGAATSLAVALGALLMLWPTGPTVEVGPRLPLGSALGPVRSAPTAFESYPAGTQLDVALEAPAGYRQVGLYNLALPEAGPPALTRIRLEDTSEARSPVPLKAGASRGPHLLIVLYLAQPQTAAEVEAALLAAAEAQPPLLTLDEAGRHARLQGALGRLGTDVLLQVSNPFTTGDQP